MPKPIPPSSDQEKVPTPEKQPTGQPPKQEPKPVSPPKKKTPAQKKDDHLKYEMKYVNGGFNNGVELKPDRDGKVNIKIAIFGGGKEKSLTVGPLPKEIAKLVRAYEIEANQGNDAQDVTQELQQYFEEKNTILSQKIILILQECDQKVEQTIKETFR